MQARGRGGKQHGKGSDKKKSKQQNYRKNQAAQQRGQEVKGGLVGFLVTCDQFKEKRCVKELFNMLNDFTDRVYPDLDHQELFEQHQKKVEIEKQEGLKRKEEYLRLKAIAQAEKEAMEKAEADKLVGT